MKQFHAVWFVLEDTWRWTVRLKTMIWFPCRYQDCLLVMIFWSISAWPKAPGWWVSQAVDQTQLRRVCAPKFKKKKKKNRIIISFEWEKKAKPTIDCPCTHPVYGSVVWSHQLCTRSHFHPHLWLLSNIAKNWTCESFSQLLSCSCSPPAMQQMTSPSVRLCGEALRPGKQVPRVAIGGNPSLAHLASSRKNVDCSTIIVLLGYYFFFWGNICVWRDIQRVEEQTHKESNIFF